MHVHVAAVHAYGRSYVSRHGNFLVCLGIEQKPHILLYSGSDEGYFLTAKYCKVC